MARAEIIRVGTVFRAAGVGDDNLYVVTYVSDLSGLHGGGDGTELAISAVRVSTLEHRLDELQAQYDAVRTEVIRQAQS